MSREGNSNNNCDQCINDLEFKTILKMIKIVMKNVNIIIITKN